MEPDTPTTPDAPETLASAPTTGRESSAARNLASSPLPSPHVSAPHDEERQTLLATLAASRDLGPEMDSELADHYLEQRALARSRALRRQQRAPRTFGQRASYAVQRLRERGLLGPVLVGAAALAFVVGGAAFATVMALHGIPLDHHMPPGANFHPDGASNASAQHGQPDGQDHDGFFPFFIFPWLIPLAVLFFVMRRRRRALAGGYQAYQQSQLGQGGQASLPSGFSAPSAADGAASAGWHSTRLPQSAPIAEDARATSSAYRPYDPFGASTGATGSLPSTTGPNTPATPQPPTGVTNEVSPPPTTKPLSNPAG